MCMSWKCFVSIMSLKGRRFSLDSSICQDGLVATLGARRGSSRFIGKKSRQSHSLDDARLQIQELNHSLSSNLPLRKQPIAEEQLDERSDGLISNSSLVKHSKTFHKLFPEIPEGENLTQAFTCALQKEVLYHGKLFVSENHVCFHSSVLLKDTKVVIPASSVREVKKHNSALSMLSVQTADGEKYSFASLRHREMCYKLLQTVCCHALQGESANSSPHHSSAENEADCDMVSSYSSLEDCSTDHVLIRQDSFCLDNGFPQMSSEGPSRSNSTRQNSLTDEDDRAVSWIWRIIEGVTPLLFLREIRNVNVLFYFYITLFGCFLEGAIFGWFPIGEGCLTSRMGLLLLVSGYIGLRIIALEEQLKSLGTLTELSFYHRDYQET